MRWDIPTRLAFLVATPLIWIGVADIDHSAIGLQLNLTGLDWLLTALLTDVAALASLVYRRWLWRPQLSPDRKALILELPFFGVLNPFAEELFFRGGALFGLAILVGMPWAIVVTSVVFGVHHVFAKFPISFLVFGTLGGALFGIVTAHFQSLAPAVLMHAGADLAVFVSSGLVANRFWGIRRHMTGDASSH